MSEKEKRKARYANLSVLQQQALRDRLNGGHQRSVTIKPLPRQYPLPASLFQESLWLQQEFETESVAYNLPVALSLTGSLNIEALEWAINQVIHRHEILRTTFSLVDGRLIQTIALELKIKLPLIDISSSSVETRDNELNRLIKKEAEEQFELVKGPLLQTKLIRLAENEHIVSLCMHHIISDGVSKDILAAEMAGYYSVFFQKNTHLFAPLPIQYADFAIWQRNQLEEGQFQPQLEYWLKQLSHLPSSLNLPVDKIYLPERQVEGSRKFFSLDRALYLEVQAFCSREGVTLFMFLIAILNVLLFRYTAQEDILIGTPVSNRRFKELEKLIGFFTNTLVVRSRPKKTTQFRDFLQEVKQTSLEAYRNQDLPYEKLVSTLQPERFANQSAIFQTLFTFQKTEQVSFNVQDLKVTSFFAEDSGAKFDLSLVSVDNNNTLEFYIEYAIDLFFPETIMKMGNHFIQLVQSAIKNPTTELQYLALLTDPEKNQILENASGNITPVYAIKGLHQLFEEQALKTPSAIAVVCANKSLSFEMLNNKANQLACYLREQGATTETLIGLFVERSLEMMIGLFAILKAGAAYVPLDPSYPQKRLSYILQDASLKVVLTQQKFHKQLRDLNEQANSYTCIELDKLLPNLSSYSTDNLNLTVEANQLAYVNYTSGSTGQPKGVMIEHRHVENFMNGIDQEIGTTVGTWLAATSISFDISVLELFWTLTRGFKVILTETEVNYSSVSTELESSIIDFSLFYFSSVDGESQDKYHLLLEGAKFADNHGFKALWTPERHFSKFGGLYPNPSVISAALAMVTKQIQLRAGSCVIPLHHPARVVEEWAVVDNLSKGRVGISFASGWQPNDFIFAPNQYETRQEVMLENIEKVRTLWRGDSLVFQGTNNRNIDVQIYPRPIQPELPIWLTSSGNPETFRKAGEMGANLLTHLLGQSVDELAEKIQIYRTAFRKHHPQSVDGTVTLMIHTFVSHDEDYVLQQVKEPLKNYLADSIALLKPFAVASGKDINNISKEDLDAVLEHAFLRYYTTSGLFGTPTSCVQFLHQIKLIDVNELACLIDFGIPPEIVLENLKYLNELKESVKPKSTTMLDKIPALMSQYGVTHFQCTPVVANLLVENEKGRSELQSLTHLLVGGEDCPLPLAHTLTRLIKGDVFNMYGPTETTVWSMVQKLSKDLDSVTIGKPIINTQAYILDSSMQLLPKGVIGELFIGGFSVMRGYLNQDKLTKEKLINLQISSERTERLYKTGDLVKYLPNGAVKYIGRDDNQVKIRGFRIELGEIESVAVHHHLILESAAVMHDDEMQGKQIVLYYTLRNGNEFGDKQSMTENLKLFLAKSLPHYMIPEHLINLDNLPLTSNGKIDRKQLSLQAMSLKGNRNDNTYVAPQLSEEMILAHIWRKVLKISQVGVHDNFFNIGGNSILAIEMLSKAREANIHLSPRELFQYPTIAQLVSELKVDNALRTKNVNELIPEIPMDEIQNKVTIVKSPVKSIFLTGATGFLGGFILRDLLEQNSIAHVYCLVRAADAEQGLSRIKLNLCHYKLWQDCYLERIIPILGDISRERLGLDTRLFENLSLDIDIIVHCAATINLVQTYEQLKPTNVEGTQQILKFASSGTHKPIHYISTLKIFSTESSGHQYQEDDDLMHGKDLDGGYTQTKWVADQIMLRAQKNGFPINIYRPGRVTGCSATGVWNTQDFACRMIKGFMQLGVAPETSAKIDLTPVDYVSRAIVHIIQREDLLGTTFHLKHPTLIPVKEIIQYIQNVGYQLQEVPYAEWYKRFVYSLQREENELHHLIGVFDSHASFDPWKGEELEVNCNNTKSALAGTNIPDFSSSKTLLKIYFDYLFEIDYLHASLKETEV